MDPALELPDGNPKTVHGISKPGIEGVPVAPLFMVGEVMRLGIRKYGLTNWRHDPISASVYYNAAMRHIMSWWDGDNLDFESQQSHLAHAVACLLILMDARLSDDLNDDRPSAGLTATYLESQARRRGATP
jgi:hypothetical protein